RTFMTGDPFVSGDYGAYREGVGPEASEEDPDYFPAHLLDL
ncbi:unnamed protein product, partial [marine sediment metagenome]